MSPGFQNKHWFSKWFIVFKIGPSFINMGPVFTNINLVFVNEGPDFLMVGSSVMGPLLYGSPELVLVVQIALSKAYTIQTSSENEMERFLYQLCLSNSLCLSYFLELNENEQTITLERGMNRTTSIKLTCVSFCFM